MDDDNSLDDTYLRRRWDDRRSYIMRDLAELLLVLLVFAFSITATGLIFRIMWWLFQLGWNLL